MKFRKLMPLTSFLISDPNYNRMFMMFLNVTLGVCTLGYWKMMENIFPVLPVTFLKGANCGFSFGVGTVICSHTLECCAVLGFLMLRKV